MALKAGLIVACIVVQYAYGKYEYGWIRIRGSNFGPSKIELFFRIY